MMLWDAAVLAATNLRKNPVRTLLTILGLGVGVGAILTVVTLGGAGQKQVETEIARLGVDKVWITADAESVRMLDTSDSRFAAAAAGTPACAGAVTLGIVSKGEASCTAQIAGYDAGMETVHQPVLLEGRMISAAEHSSGAPVALADESLAVQLGGDVCGARVFVGSRAVRIVGVVRDMAVQAAGSGMVIVPLTTFLDTYPSAQIAEMTVSVPAGAQAEEIGGMATAALEKRGGSFRAASLQEEIDAARSVIRIFVMVLACVAAVCMLTGSIGVMNILLVSVRERRREIGLLKAVGGTARQVGTLFLLEAVCYAVLGCVLGLLLGVAMIRLFGVWIGLQAVLSLETAAVTVLAACALGVGFGVVPALRAAGMVPVEALKGDA